MSMNSPEVMEATDQYLNYRAVSVSSVATLVIAIMSLPAIFFAKLLVLPALGTLLGIYAYLKVRKRQNELTGIQAARIGLALCILVFAAGTARSSYVYATEVPAGYTRISFEALQPKENPGPLPIPESALALDGKKIFVKGYVHPGVERRKGIKQFILVPDMKTCCFGGQPALTDMIEVTLKDPKRIDYSWARRNLAGTLRVSPYKKSVKDLDGVYYQLEADYVR